VAKVGNEGVARRSPLNYCVSGCGSSLLLILLIVAIAYSFTGRYHVTIPPTQPLPVPNAFDDYLAAAKLLAQNGGTSSIYPARGFSVSLTAEKTLVSNNQPALALARTGMKKSCRVPWNRSWTGNTNYLADSRELARLFMSEADVRAAKGDHLGAFESGLDAINLGQDISRGGPVIHGLVSTAIQTIGQSPMIPAIEHLTSADCSIVITRMQAILQTRQPYRETLEEEVNTVLENTSNMRDWRSMVSQTSGNKTGVVADGERFFGEFGWHFMKDRTLRDLKNYFDEFMPQLDKPKSLRKQIPVPKSTIAQIILPVFENTGDKFEETDARNRIILCAVAIRRYRRI
jgi:hypothetical protein